MSATIRKQHFSTSGSIQRAQRTPEPSKVPTIADIQNVEFHGPNGSEKFKIINVPSPGSSPENKAAHAIVTAKLRAGNYAMTVDEIQTKADISHDISDVSTKFSTSENPKPKNFEHNSLDLAKEKNMVHANMVISIDVMMKHCAADKTQLARMKAEIVETSLGGKIPFGYKMTKLGLDFVIMFALSRNFTAQKMSHFQSLQNHTTTPPDEVAHSEPAKFLQLEGPASVVAASWEKADQEWLLQLGFKPQDAIALASLFNTFCDAMLPPLMKSKQAIVDRNHRRFQASYMSVLRANTSALEEATPANKLVKACMLMSSQAATQIAEINDALSIFGESGS